MYWLLIITMQVARLPNTPTTMNSEYMILNGINVARFMWEAPNVCLQNITRMEFYGVKLERDLR